jgi:TPR repeat protein
MKRFTRVALFLVVAPGMTGFAPAETSGHEPPYAASGEAEGVAALQIEADQGQPAALNSLGILYAQGKGVPRDYGAAARYFRQSALQGYAPAMANLGFLYESGIDGRRDDQEAYAWLLLAVSAGVADRDHDVTIFRMGMLAERMGRLKVSAAEARAKEIAATVNPP